tara:strand:+ start:182 stop:355 length:174 start_codon:yes stop_codon:yes gene_type:complete
MKQLIPYLLFSVTTVHAVLGVSPVIAMSCSSHDDKTENICEEGDNDCQSKYFNSKVD